MDDLQSRIKGTIERIVELKNIIIELKQLNHNEKNVKQTNKQKTSLKDESCIPQC